MCKVVGERCFFFRGEQQFPRKVTQLHLDLKICIFREVCIQGRFVNKFQLRLFSIYDG